MRSLAGLAVALAVVLAGCSAPVALPDADDGRHSSAVPGDPSTDRLGWEAGYWYNESLAIAPGDGLNATERRAVVARAMARVEHLRGLEFQETVPVRVVSRETYRREFAGGNRTYTDAFRRFDNAKFEALFLVGEDEGSLGVQDENRGANVLGVYSGRNESIIVVAEAAGALPGESTLAHELVHALQDQHYGLDSFERPTRERHNAVNGLIEGDATLVDRAYARRCEGAWDCFAPDEGDERRVGGGNVQFGVYFLNYFPYSDGPPFVAHWRDRGGWERVNRLYDAPPASTEQVIYPDRYNGDAPTDVSLADRTAGGWERVRLDGAGRSRPDHAVLGQSALSAAFAYTLVDPHNRTAVVSREAFVNEADGQLDRSDPFNYDLRYTDGWDGDRLHVYRRGDQTGYVWRLVWDSPAEAAEFVGGYRALLSHWGGSRVEPGVWYIDRGPFADAFAVRRTGDTVTVVNAPTVDALDDVRAPP